MAVTVDQASLGTQATSTGATTSTQTTGATVAAGAMIFALVGNFNSGTETLTVSGGGLTWVPVTPATLGGIQSAAFYAFAPAGLASGTTITVTADIVSNDMTWAMNSYLGVDTTGTVTAFNAASVTGTGWSSGSVGANAGDALIGGATSDGAVTSSTATGPAVERVDFSSGTTSGAVTIVDKLSVAGTDSLAGTWANSVDTIGTAVAFKAAAAGGATEIPILVMAPPTPA